MAGKTAIEWTEATWNPTPGCDRVSAGCDNCYALTLAKRLKSMGSKAYQMDGNPATSGPGFLAHEEPRVLGWPLRQKAPQRIFVNSMGDLFHANISDRFIAQVCAVIALAPQHTFQVLTKRHGRARSLFNSPQFHALYAYELGSAMIEHQKLIRTQPLSQPAVWPLPNLWQGVSVENADVLYRIDALRQTPAAVRFLSAEPLLGPLDGIDLTGIGWVIAGGESGPGARPMHPDWPRSLRDQCLAAGVPFLFKQWGEWVTEDQSPQDITLPSVSRAPFHGDALSVYCVGKKAAGRELDGRTWNEYPAGAR